MCPFYKSFTQKALFLCSVFKTFNQISSTLYNVIVSSLDSKVESNSAVFILLTIDVLFYFIIYTIIEHYIFQKLIELGFLHNYK